MLEPEPNQPGKKAEPREAVWLPVILVCVVVAVIGGSCAGHLEKRETYILSIVVSIGTVLFAYGCPIGYGLGARWPRWWRMLLPIITVLIVPETAIFFMQWREPVQAIYWWVGFIVAQGLFFVAPMRKVGRFLAVVVVPLWTGAQLLGAPGRHDPAVFPLLLFYCFLMCGWTYISLAIGRSLRNRIAQNGENQPFVPVRRLIPRQFSLASMFILTTIVAVLVAIVAPLARNPVVIAVVAMYLEWAIVVGIVMCDGEVLAIQRADRVQEEMAEYADRIRQKLKAAGFAEGSDPVESAEPGDTGL